MSNLFRFNLKKNTGVFFNKNKNLIKKFYLSYRQKKNTKLLNEFNGLSWYFKKLKKIFKYNYLIASNNVNYFEYSLIKGNKFKFWDRFIFEKNKIRAVINHYKKVWPKNSYVPFHGDLTLENILFLNSKEVIFIDWENYKKKKSGV